MTTSKKRVIFLDCGTHEGQGLSELVSQLPAECEIHCFEPNPSIKSELNAESLMEIARDKGLIGGSLVLHRDAIYDRDGHITFNSIGGFPRGINNGRGQSSSIAEVGQKAGVVSSQSVPCVDLLRFVRDLALQPGDELFIKLDIEGAEFVVLERMLTQGSDVLPYLKQLWVEWHERYFAAGAPEHAAVETLTTRLQAVGVNVTRWQ